MRFEVSTIYQEETTESATYSLHGHHRQRPFSFRVRNSASSERLLLSGRDAI